ncbi:helix-turn-helix transcriptional regulator [Saccharibacillus sp. CPCC 101409]|uniref:helix-turn-helix transcriptional regulator n=1 Tax=Saccharibacillus sp. CPCC 101409 TaxID=3058041 RepID=UPI002673E428|nr:helix-turn-helix transcriptional regulator [Saccharibacillus sp. CPCC 101409]MDO3410427.1 helix-turn-helix transcriptional regulator [Saccharibacillus sp. CPCC 101409]
MNDHERRLALGNFLRNRRASLSPPEVGLPPAGRRRTQGLRREEVAAIANIGLSWYTRLEQGRDIHPSTDVLESLASALQLTANERRHLFLLAGDSPPPQSTIVEEKIGASVQDMLDKLNPNPAYVIGKKWDFLAWNQAADALFTIVGSPLPHGYNLMWRQFTDPMWREGSEDWNSVSRRMAAEFRTSRARYLSDASFDRLIEDLKKASPDFATMWQQHEVSRSLDGYKKLLHPDMGAMEFEQITLQFPNEPDQRIMIYMPDPAAKSQLEHYLAKMQTF